MNKEIIKSERLPLYVYMQKFYASIQYCCQLFLSIVILISIPAVLVWTLYYMCKFSIVHIIGGVLIMHSLLSIQLLKLCVMHYTNNTYIIVIRIL